MLTVNPERRISIESNKQLRKRQKDKNLSAMCRIPVPFVDTANFGSPQVSSALFFQYNTALVPPYSILVDTNFLSHTVQNKLELLPTMMDCLYAKCTPIITDCVMAELEKLGTKYRIALQIARDERWERLKCDHKGTYADDCLVTNVTKHKIYIVATNDRDLKRRIRKIPGIPIMSVARGKYLIERLPDAPEK